MKKQQPSITKHQETELRKLKKGSTKMIYHIQTRQGVKPQPLIFRLDFKSVVIARARILGGIRASQNTEDRHHLTSFTTTGRKFNTLSAKSLTVKTKTTKRRPGSKFTPAAIGKSHFIYGQGNK